MIAANQNMESNLLAQIRAMGRFIESNRNAMAHMVFRSNHHLVLQHGKLYQPANHRFHPTPKACYARAYHTATRKNSRWVYVEGYAACKNSMGIAVQHAWITRADKPGEAIDLAWGYEPEAAYIGIAFRPEYVHELLWQTGSFSVLDNESLRYPLLTGETKLEDVIWKGKV